MWGAFIRSGVALGGYRILVDEAAEPVVSADRGGSRGFEWSCWRVGFGWREAESAVRPMSVVVVDKLAENVLQVLAVCDQQPLEALASYGADEPLGYSVCLRRPDRRVEHPDPLGVEHGAEGARELAVAVSDHELQGSFSFGEREHEIPRLLRCPRTVWVLGHASEVHARLRHRVQHRGDP